LIAALWLPLGSGAASENRAQDASVAVIAVPTSMGAEATSETRRLAEDIAGKMRSAGFRVVLEGVQPDAALEELAAIAAASSSDLVLGVRSLRGSKVCSNVVSPVAAPRPAQPKDEVSQAELAAQVKQLMATSRAEASKHLAVSLSSTGRWCPSTPTNVEQYFLDALAAPTVLISTAPPDAAAVSERIPGVVKEWILKVRSDLAAAGQKELSGR